MCRVAGVRSCLEHGVATGRRDGRTLRCVVNVAGYVLVRRR
jgi:hypothetical protein